MKLPDVLKSITDNNLNVLLRPVSWQNTGNAFKINNNQIISCADEKNLNSINNINLLQEDWVMLTHDLLNNERSCNY